MCRSTKGQADEALLKKLIEDHHRWTGSLRAREILDNWSTSMGKFVKVFPTEYRRALTEMGAKQKPRPQLPRPSPPRPRPDPDLRSELKWEKSLAFWNLSVWKRATKPLKSASKLQRVRHWFDA